MCTYNEQRMNYDGSNYAARTKAVFEGLMPRFFDVITSAIRAVEIFCKQRIEQSVPMGEH
jgi:hypothetical protein